VLAFQPHRYTRTRDCFADFVQGAGPGRRGLADRGLRRRRSADRRRRRRGAGARALQAAGSGDRQFVDDVRGRCRRWSPNGHATATWSSPMGAGSIGAVPQQVVDLMLALQGRHNDDDVNIDTSSLGKVAVLMGGTAPSARCR
jgi:hypothetical protein